MRTDRIIANPIEPEARGNPGDLQDAAPCGGGACGPVVGMMMASLQSPEVGALAGPQPLTSTRRAVIYRMPATVVGPRREA